MTFLHRAPTLGRSSSSYLNFLWKDDDRLVYVMDNHLGALWCWLRELASEDEYSLVHIDWHWDAAPGDDVPRLMGAELKAGAQALPLEKFLGLKNLRDDMALLTGEPFPIVRWDNYMQPLPQLRRHARDAYLFAHQHDTNTPKLAFEHVEDWNSPDGLSWLHVALPRARGTVLINLDLDYFFLSLNEQKRQAFTDDFITTIVRTLADSLAKGGKKAIWTVAWSPECCGGWDHAARVCRLVCGELGIRCVAEELGF